MTVDVDAGLEAAAGSGPVSDDEAGPVDVSDALLDGLFASLSPSEGVRAVSFRLTKVNADMAICTLFDGSEAFLPVSEWFPQRRWKVGDAGFGLLVPGERRTVSVTRPELVGLLMSGLVPEVRDGDVRVMGVSRLPGVRAKVAVAAVSEDVDPVAVCVGRRANRVSALVGLLGGERVDVIPWSSDGRRLLEAALAPARPDRITFSGRSASVFVPPHRMAATVGAGGLNAQLAGRLAGFKVQVFADRS